MKNESIKRLPDAELTVMQALWDCPSPAARADIEAALPGDCAMAMTTLLTQLSRLGEKGFVDIARQGRRCLYTPLVSRSDYLAAQSGSFIKKLCGGDIPTFAAALCDSGLSREDLDELRRLLERDAL